MYLVKEIKTDKTAPGIFELFHSLPYSMFFDSSLIDYTLGKYSIIVFNPFLTFKSKGYNIELIQNGEIKKIKSDPLKYLKVLLKRYKTEYSRKLPFFSGCAGIFSYDLCRIIEKLPDSHKNNTGIPDIVLGFYNNAVIFDHKQSKTYITVSSAGVKNCNNTEEYLEQNISRIEKIIHNNKKQVYPSDTIFSRDGYAPHKRAGAFSMQNISGRSHHVKSNFTKEEYCRMVQKAKEYIRNGDIFQVNLSQQFSTKTNVHPFEIYKYLRKINPAPFSAYLNLDNYKVLSSSCERFIKIRDRTIETRPIKGTRPRGKTFSEDNKQKKALLNSKKDQAELTMIIDLERNDLGKISEIGSVHVDKFIELEKYATVFHLVSTIKGKLLNNSDIIDCIKATFPGGSITGAPKIRAMEIIDELEPLKRGVYTGSMGYIGFDCNCDLNIAIRTLTFKNNKAFYNVGGGIVWDSVPEDEYMETLKKGEALIKALQTGGLK